MLAMRCHGGPHCNAVIITVTSRIVTVFGIFVIIVIHVMTILNIVVVVAEHTGQ